MPLSSRRLGVEHHTPLGHWDSQGNVWVTNRFGNGLLGIGHLADMGVHAKAEGIVPAMDYMTRTMSTQKGGSEGGSVTLLRPDGNQYPGSPFSGGSLPGPRAAVVDGNDNVWISNFAGAAGQIAHLCGVRTENWPARRAHGRPDFASPRLRRWWPAAAG